MTYARRLVLVAGVVFAVALPACGGQAPTSLSGSGSAQPLSPVVTVHLAAAYSPSVVRLKTGQRFLLVVSASVQASGVPVPGGCPSGAPRQAAGGLLSVQCMAHGRYLYTAKRAGSATLWASVRPRCKPATMCPQWVSRPSLGVTVS